jgi:putative inorganic carbon (hco3(-)) transporter
MLRTIFVLLILIPGVAAALTSRFAALLVYLWFALFRPQEWLWIDTSGLRLSLILSLLVVVPLGWIVTNRSSGQSLRRRLANEAWPNLTHPLTIGMAIFFGIALVAQTQALDPAIGWSWLDYLWRVFLVSMVAVSLISTRERFFAVMVVTSVSLGFHATKGGISSLLGGGVRYQQGLGGTFVDNNGYALAIVMILFFLVAVGQNTDRRWLRWVFFASVIPSGYTIVSTFSRAGFLAAAVAVLAFAALQRRRAAALLLVAAVGVVAYLVVPIPKGYFDRLETIQTYEDVGEESALSRLHFWRVAIDIVSDHPLGVGLRNYEVAYDRYDFLGGRYGRRRSVHSSHFQVLAETGFAGMAIWVGLFSYAMFVCARIRARSRHVALNAGEQRFYFTMANALIVSMAGFIVGGAFIALALNDLTWLTFALVAALDRLSAKAIDPSVAAASIPVFRPPVARGAAHGQVPPFQGAYKGIAPSPERGGQR